MYSCDRATCTEIDRTTALGQHGLHTRRAGALRKTSAGKVPDQHEQSGVAEDGGVGSLCRDNTCGIPGFQAEEQPVLQPRAEELCQWSQEEAQTERKEVDGTQKPQCPCSCAGPRGLPR